MATAVTPAENTTDWIGSLGKGPLKKVAYGALDWVNKQVGGEQTVPGAQKQETSQKDFMGFLKDGSVLGKLANKLQPGSIETVHEKPTETEKQSENVNGFLKFAKEKAGLGDKDLFKADDLMGGKGFTQVLGTLVNLGGNSQEKFGIGGLNMESLMQMATAAAGKNFIQSLLEKIPNPFKKSAPAADAVENAPTTAAPPEEVKESKPAESPKKATENGENKTTEEKPPEEKPAPVVLVESEA